MKSRISFFNRGIAQNLLRRFWPLWAAYFCLLLLILPGELASQATVFSSIGSGAISYEEAVAGMDLCAVDEGIAVVYISAFVGVIAAMAMFHYLYQSKSCGMMNCLPLRRETMFLTAWLTGIVPLLLSDLLVVLVTALLFCTRGLLHVSALLEFLVLAAMGNIAFYGFAVFCAMLTGNILVLPAVYLVLNFAVAAVEGCGRELLSLFVFGMVNHSSKLHFLSPPVLLMEQLNITRLQPLGYMINGLGALAAYCAAGLLLSAAALLLYRRRRMETAGDVVAVRILKPVFQYCLCFGTALVVADLLLASFYRFSLRGLSAALLILALMLVGAFIGYFAAEMLMQKTLKVFHGKWRGFAVACGVILLFVGVFEFDLTGFEKRVPSPEDVECVSLWSGGEVAELRDPAQIARAAAFHRDLIADKAACERDAGDAGLTIFYHLSDGRTLDRTYRLPTADKEDPDSLLRRAEALLNAPEAILARARADRPLSPETLVGTEISYGFLDESTDPAHLVWTGVSLTAEEAMSLYQEGILPDARDGHIALAHLVHDEYYEENVYSLAINFTCREQGIGNDPRADMFYLGFPVERSSVNTLQWLREHTNLEPKTYAELGAG